MDEVIMIIVMSIFSAIMIILLFREMKTDEIENSIREEQLKKIQKNIEYHKKISGFQDDDSCYKIGEWEDEVRENMLAIVDVEQKYKVNKPLKALVGDYDKSSVSNTVSVLESMGIGVNIAKSGREILKRMQNNENYDFIVTNNIYDRGHLDGPQTLEKLKEIDGFNVPVIVLTVSEGKRHLFIDEFGFDEYMTKLLTQEKVLEAIPKVIKDLKFTKIKSDNL